MSTTTGCGTQSAMSIDDSKPTIPHLVECAPRLPEIAAATSSR
jgi:hypothetical protein